MEILKEIVNKLIEKHMTISTMESCTGGFVVNAITNIEGASEVLKYSAITYSNEFKEKMGVDKKIIDKYSVYSKEVADEMSKKISAFTNSDYSIGVTGKLNRVDVNNTSGEDNKVYFSIYDKNNDKIYSYELYVDKKNRIENKEQLNEDFEQEVIAFLNYKEGGIIYVGINKHGQVVGINDIDLTQLQIKDRIKNNINLNYI